MPVPPAEVQIDAALVRALLADQHPDLAALALHPAAEGWDNVTFRLGDELAIRLPRREAALPCTRSEHEWLMQLATQLPVGVPAPVRLGRPGVGYPWPWSVVPWFHGQTADDRPLGPVGARVLGDALRALHLPAPPQAPRNPYRGGTLADRPDPLPGLHVLYADEPPRALLRVWERALQAPPDRVPVWTHGDLHARNVLVAADGSVEALIDWGDLGAGDPAVDLSALWTVLAPADHAAFCAAYGPVDGPLLLRARGWALVFGVLFAGLHDDPGAAALGRRTLDLLQG